MKNYYASSLFLFLFAYQITDLATSNPADDVKIREKRNIICLFGLTDIIKETVYVSLLDARKQDVVSISDAWEGRLYDGQLKGLSTLTNVTDLKVFCDDNNIIVFTTTLRMKEALVWYKWKRQVLFKLKGSVWMKAKEVDFDLEVRLNATSGLSFKVTNSLVTKVDDFQIGFKGLGMLNKVVQKILRKTWKNKAADKIGSLIKTSLEKKLGKISDSFDWMTFL